MYVKTQNRSKSRDLLVKVKLLTKMWYRNSHFVKGISLESESLPFFRGATLGVFTVGDNGENEWDELPRSGWP